MNVCVVGYGMMGVWHSEALKRNDAVLHTVVGRRPQTSTSSRCMAVRVCASR